MQSEHLTDEPSSFFDTATAAFLVPTLTGMLLIAVLLVTMGFPEPYVHDEFAYLLGADTFLEGRLTNPSPPLPEAFETFHVNVEPTYHSKYPPAQSVFLAIGILLMGDGIYGAWLSFVLAILATVWALLAVCTPRWALLGGLLTLINPTLLIKWAFSYWGGAVALLGGALFVGGLLRILRSPKISHAVWMGIGLCVMSFSRPLEGLLTAALALSAGTACLWLRKRSSTERRPYLPALGILALAGALILALNAGYNWALTGTPFTFPHRLWDPDGSRHALIQNYSGSGATTTRFRISRLFLTFIGPFLWILLPFAWRKWREPGILIGTLTVTFLFLYVPITSRAWPLYVAPAVPLVILILVRGAGGLSHWTPGAKPAGKAALALLLTVHFGYQLYATSRQAPEKINFSLSRDNGMTFKQDLEAFFREKPGQHLVVVRYLPGHNSSWEFVYNRADLPSAKVIWVRELEPGKMEQLFEIYPNRQTWLLKVQTRPLDLISLSVSGRGTSADEAPAEPPL